MYGKIFNTLFTGSMRGKGDLQLVFMYLISNATADGICDFTPQCISDATGKPLDLIHACIEELQTPDEMSRTRTDNGRRIALLDDGRTWGWRIINYDMYRKIGSGDDLRTAERLRKREYRDKKKRECPKVSRTSPGPFTSPSPSSSGSEEGGAGGELAEGMTIQQTADAILVCHPDFNERMRMQVENAIKPIIIKGKLTKDGAERINLMAMHYAGAAMRKPVGHLLNFINHQERGGIKDSSDQAEYKRTVEEVSKAVWDAKDCKPTKDELRRALSALRDKYKDAPRSEGGKDPVQAGIDLAMNNKRARG